MPTSPALAEFHDMLRLAQQGYIHFPESVQDIDRRAREGDEVWRGDPTMGLFFNYIDKRWEIIGRDEHGNQYVAAWSEYPDLSLIQSLAKGDWQRGKALAAEHAKGEAKVRADHEARLRDARHERIERAATELRKVVGHHYGGLSRKFFSLSEGRR